MQFIARIQGRQNRAYLYDQSYVQRGSFPSTELLSNNEFSSGTTGWIAGGNFNASIADGVFRSTRNQSGAAASIIARAAGITVSPYLPHAMRFFTALGAGVDPSTLTCRIDDTSTTSGTTAAWAPLRTQIHLTVGSTLTPRIVQVVPAAIAAGAFIDVLYASMARCIVADNSPNTALQSDDFSNASWSKNLATITVNAGTAPDGTTTADSLIETASTGLHYAEQSFTVPSAAADFTDTFCVKAGARGWVSIQLIENTGATTVQQWINLSTGALGTNSTGGNWANLRCPVPTDIGNGWYRVTLTATKTNAATTVRARVTVTTGDGVGSYAGDGTSNILVWRGAFQQTPYPFLPAATTTTASTGTAPSGISLNVKGLPASTAGLLLPGDQVEILTSFGSELKIVTAQLDSDAGGLGTLFVAPRLRGTMSDGAAIVTCRPIGRFVYSGTSNMEWTTDPGIITAASFEFEEAVG